MTSFWKYLLLAFSLAIAASGRADDGPMVLWWQVGAEDDYTETGESLRNVQVEMRDGNYTTAYDIGANVARIKETSTGTYLDILDPETGEFSLESIDVPQVWAADVSAYAAGSPEYMFVIELGNYESGSWSTLAVSEAATYADLSGSRNIVQWDHGFSPQSGPAWNPTAYVVPEPNSGLLVLLGTLLLALRRGGRKAHA